MEELSCQTCGTEFYEDIAVPKVLDCGHSFCFSCVANFFDNDSNCPTCSEDVSKDAHMYPTNYALLGVCSVQSCYRFIACRHTTRLLTINNMFNALNDELAKKKIIITSNLKKIKSGLWNIQKMLKDDSDVNLKQANQNLVKLDADYKRVENKCYLSYCKMRMAVTINLASFDAHTQYTEKIYDILSKGKQIFSVHQVEDKIKYGKVSIQNNMIIVHNLTLTNIPWNVESLWLNDLKKCITRHDFRTFLKLSCNERGISHLVVIKMMDSQLVPQFVRLCTGECGPSYKESRFEKGQNIPNTTPIMLVKKYVENDVETSGSFDYGMNSTTQIPFQYNDLIVMGWVTGSFQISRCDAYTSYSNVLGKVMTPLNLDDLISYEAGDKLKVVDSGFLFEL